MRLVSIAPNPSIDRLYELDRLRIGAINRPLGETLVAGGKGLNVARAAASLGADVTSFDAGFLTGWLEGRSLADCLSLGAVRGALSTQGIGGTATQPTMEEAAEALKGWSR